MLEKVTLPVYSKEEEIFNGISHGIGILFSIFAMIYFILNSSSKTSVYGSVIYGIATTILYFSSTMYHTVKKEKIKKIFRLIDHSAIFLMISGIVLALNVITIYPVNKLLSVFGSVATVIVAVVGLALTFIDQEKYKNVQMILYVAISCIPIFGAKTLFDTHEKAQLITILLVTGGIVYGIGMALYIISKKKNKKYFHSIFHLFILGGTFIHFYAILNAI